MNNWNIGKRISAGFGAVIMISLVLGIFAYLKVGIIHTSSVDISENSLPSVYLIGEMQSNTQAFYALLMRHIVATDPAEMARIDIEVKERRARTAGLFTSYEKLISNDKDRELFKAIKDARGEFKVGADEVLRVSSIGTLEAKKQALESMAKVKPLQDKYVAATVAEVEFNQGLAAESSKAVESSVSSARTGILIGLIAAIIVACCIAVFIVRGITTPLQELANRVKSIAGGDLSGKPLEPRSKDEIAELGLAMNEMTRNLRSLVSGISSGVQTLGMSATQLSAVSAQTASGVSSMSEKSRGVAAAAEQASASTISVSSGMDESSVNLTSIASATEQMSATVGDIAANTARARSTSEQATSKAVTISEQMQKLGLAAQEIGQVTETITNISAQTNLLALNATIEAARAGAAGKGFAVVANEIKELARQTAEATEDIKTRIAAVQNSTGSAISDIDQITAVIKEVGGIVSNIAAAIEEQAAVTKDVAGNIAQASASVREANSHISETAEVSKSIAKDIAGVNADVADIRRGGEQVQASAVELTNLAGQLKTQVAQFRM